MLIEPAGAADSGRCQEIAVAAWERIHDERRRLLGEALHEQLKYDWRTAKAGQVARHFDEHLDWVLVARMEEGGEAIGFVTFRLDREKATGTIGNNAVDPGWQGRGIATAMYGRVLERFRGEGMRVACVVTGLDEGHAPALATYRKVGFDHEVPSVTLYQELR
jgi:ribosomal protein S18 acetylase RimI-like enzyme